MVTSHCVIAEVNRKKKGRRKKKKEERISLRRWCIIPDFIVSVSLATSVRYVDGLEREASLGELTRNGRNQDVLPMSPVSGSNQKVHIVVFSLVVAPPQRRDQRSLLFFVELSMRWTNCTIHLLLVYLSYKYICIHCSDNLNEEIDRWEASLCCLLIEASYIHSIQDNVDNVCLAATDVIVMERVSVPTPVFLDFISMCLQWWMYVCMYCAQIKKRTNRACNKALGGSLEPNPQEHRCGICSLLQQEVVSMAGTWWKEKNTHQWQHHILFRFNRFTIRLLVVDAKTSICEELTVPQRKSLLW